MIRQKILQQLLEWIECNLEHPISIEDIAQKSGYSRRNIQLLFRNFMHVPLGEYIRKRRLCRAAILVRLTAKSMLDIALSLHFDSQQSFSREFKKLFGCSPREYRQWTINRGLYASFRYEGEWEHYPEWARNLYLMELPARGLARVNGSDIERFYYNEDFVEKDSNDVVCEIFIPVRPV
ncbi:MAG: helix-turn-helix domain-containing protein [Escherichia coli]|nr:helix-turn-helix domain-containing protein [Escherichia coli]